MNHVAKIHPTSCQWPTTAIAACENGSWILDFIVHILFILRSGFSNIHEWIKHRTSITFRSQTMTYPLHLCRDPAIKTNAELCDSDENRLSKIINTVELTICSTKFTPKLLKSALKKRGNYGRRRELYVNNNILAWTINCVKERRLGCYMNAVRVK
jgi:hypothetical protein